MKGTADLKHKRVAVIVFSCVLVFCILHWLPSILLAFMYVGGRSDCSFSRTVSAVNWEMLYQKTIKDIRARSHVLKTDEDMQLWSTPRGNFWSPSGGVPAEALAEEELEVYGSRNLAGVNVGDVVLDCGADIGLFTREALREGASLVVAIEPSASKIRYLRRNFEHEIAQRRVIVCPKGVWNKTESHDFYGMSLVMGNDQAIPSERVNLVTIDDLMEDLRFSRVDFIKMDIEGAEKQALMGAARTLAKFRPRLAISCEHYVTDAKDIPRVVSRLGPDYTPECGPCVRWGSRYYPYVLYFRSTARRN